MVDKAFRKHEINQDGISRKLKKMFGDLLDKEI